MLRSPIPMSQLCNAHREATEAYKRGGLKAYGSVDEMMDDILSESNDE